MMKIKRKQLVLILTGLTCGVGLGFLISLLLFPQNDTNVLSPPQESTTIPSAAVETDSQESDSVPTNLVEIAQLEKVTEQRIALYQLLDNRNGAQIAELLGSTLTFDSSENLYSAQRILFAELARIEPAKALELIWETERARWRTLLDEIAIHWGLIAPKEALKAFAALKDPWRGRATRTVFDHQQSLNETELAELAGSLDITDQFLLWKYEIELAGVIDEPRKAFDLTLQADISYLDKSKMLTLITNRWIERTGTDDIRAKLNLVFEVFGDTRGLWAPVVTEITKNDPSFLWEQLTAMSLEIQKRFSGSIFREWAAIDPNAAVQVLHNRDFMAQMEFYRYSFIGSWVDAVEDRFLEHIELLPEADKILAIRMAVENLAHSSLPNDVLELLGQLKSRGLNTLEATDSFVKIWSRKDLLAALEWVLQNKEQGRYDGQYMLGDVLEQLALSDPERAMKIALEQPEESSLDVNVVMKLLRLGEFDKALTLAPKVRKKRWYGSIYHNVAYSLVGAGRTDEALALAEKVEESERTRFYQNLVFPWLYSDPDSLLEQLSHLETAEVRAIFAAEVLKRHESFYYLTEKEIEFVRTFIPDDTN